jgi:hypothetical protein
MNSQTLVPVSAASTGWTSPSDVLTQNDVVTFTAGANASGTGLVVYLGTLDSGGAPISVSLTQAWTEANASPKADLNCWLSPDGSSKIGTPTAIQLPYAPYMPGTNVNQISPTPLAVGFSGAQGLAGMYLIIEQQAGGAPPNYTNLDYVEAEATWPDTGPGAGAVFFPPYATSIA